MLEVPRFGKHSLYDQCEVGSEQDRIKNLHLLSGSDLIPLKKAKGRQRDFLLESIDELKPFFSQNKTKPQLVRENGTINPLDLDLDTVVCVFTNYFIAETRISGEEKLESHLKGRESNSVTFGILKEDPDNQTKFLICISTNEARLKDGVPSLRACQDLIEIDEWHHFRTQRAPLFGKRVQIDEFFETVAVAILGVAGNHAV